MTERTSSSCLEMVPSAQAEPMAGAPDALRSSRGRGAVLQDTTVRFRSALWHCLCGYTGLCSNLASLSPQVVSAAEDKAEEPHGLLLLSRCAPALLRLQNKGKTEMKEP